ncbi:MAG: hypothetical protein Q7T48_19530 [Cellvibrio sp.]|uniref:hypothetical protein n=1 Tax=Cellvibrio sp. TaxID=1965322 RepID=UPI0027235178|nr:hypothetical protein [Cellvibrio sp.]
MKSAKKVIGCIFALVFSQSAFAIIIEGTFSGRLGSFINDNMDVTADAKFWHNNENEYQPFTGTFWYDTELAGPPINKERINSSLVQYIQEGDWLHTTVVGANGESLEVNSRGSSRSFSSNPIDGVSIEQYDNGLISYGRLTMFYDDFKGNSHRAGSLLIVADTPVINGLNLTQSFQIASDLDANDQPIGSLGSIGFGTRGVKNGIHYEGQFWGSLTQFEIHPRASAVVSEPSSLFLFLGPLMLLFWRAGLLSTTGQNQRELIYFAKN